MSTFDFQISLNPFFFAITCSDLASSVSSFRTVHFRQTAPSYKDAMLNQKKEGREPTLVGHRSARRPDMPGIAR